MRTRVAVVGGGSTGASILYHLAKRGVTDSVLIEKGQSVGSGQTSRSTALVRTHYSVPVVAKMALLSYRFFRDFGRELPGRESGYVETGLLVGVNQASERSLDKNLETYRSLGIESRRVSSDEVRHLEPMLDTSAFSSVVYEPNMGYAEPSTTAASFASAAQELGARLLPETEVTRLARSAGGYTLSTSHGEVEASKVVLATGVWSGPLFAQIGIPLPIKPVRHPVAIYSRPEEFSGKRPVVFDFARSAYYKPEGKGLLFVGSMEAELDESSLPVDPESYDQGITFEEAEKFTRWTTEAYPLMGTEGTFERGYSGVYDNTPDQQPIIDELSEWGYPGLYCLVGLSGHGFKLSPEFGRVMASMVEEGSFKDYDVSVFRLKRFETGELLRGTYDLSTIG